MWYRDNENLYRVRKDTARRLQKKGDKVYMLPCLLTFNNRWIKPQLLLLLGDFDKMVKEYEASNCNPLNGNYCAFYAEKGR